MSSWTKHFRAALRPCRMALSSEHRHETLQGRKLLEPWGSSGRPLSVSMHDSVNVELQPLKKGRVIGDQDGSGRNVGVFAPCQEPGPAGVGHRAG